MPQEPRLLFLLSAKVALSASECILRSSFLLNSIIQNFTRIDAPRTAAGNIPNSTSAGLIILSMPSRSSPNPIATISAATTNPAKYSYLPCPYGCSRSADFSLSLNPIRLITLEDASERLFAASAVIDTLPDKIPAMNFPAHKKRLQIIPTFPESFP